MFKAVEGWMVPSSVSREEGRGRRLIQKVSPVFQYPPRTLLLNSCGLTCSLDTHDFGLASFLISFICGKEISVVCSVLRKMLPSARKHSSDQTAFSKRLQ